MPSNLMASWWADPQGYSSPGFPSSAASSQGPSSPAGSSMSGVTYSGMPELAEAEEWQVFSFVGPTVDPDATDAFLSRWVGHLPVLERGKASIMLDSLISQPLHLPWCGPGVSEGDRPTAAGLHTAIVGKTGNRNMLCQLSCNPTEVNHFTAGIVFSPDQNSLKGYRAKVPAGQHTALERVYQLLNLTTPTVLAGPGPSPTTFDRRACTKAVYDALYQELRFPVHRTVDASLRSVDFCLGHWETPRGMRRGADSYVSGRAAQPSRADLMTYRW